MINRIINVAILNVLKEDDGDTNIYFFMIDA